MRNQLLHSIEQCLLAIQQLQSPEAIAFMEKSAQLLADTFSRGGKLLIAGNGGSLCDAAHFAEELTGIFRKKRPALPAIALTDPGHITCVGNDLGYESVFSRAVEAYGKPGDVLVVLTTSGNSPSILRALEKAKELSMPTVAFLGKEGGKAKSLADLEWIVSGFSTSDRIQEAHMAAIHLIIELIEYKLFPEILKSVKMDVCEYQNAT